MTSAAEAKGRLANRQTSKDVIVFKGRSIFAANMIAGPWLVIGSYFAIVAFLIWRAVEHEQLTNDRILFSVLLANGILGLLALVPGRLLAMWPYAIALEPQKGIWVYAPPARLWIPLDEIVDIGVYSGVYGGGHVIQLSRSHGLVKQLYFNPLFSPTKGSSVRFAMQSTVVMASLTKVELLIRRGAHSW